MSLSIKEWENNISDFNDDTLIRFSEALETLSEWEEFEEHFGEGQSLSVLRTMFMYEIGNRKALT